MMRITKKGQSILEYTLVIGAVMAVIILVLLSGNRGGIKNKIFRTYTKTGDAINASANQANVGVFANTTAQDMY